MDNLCGSILQVRFYSEESGFVVALMQDETNGQHVWITGRIRQFNRESRYRVYGEYVVHPKYGEQYKFNRYEEILASGYEETIRYLSSSLFKGIGKVQATHIVEALGEDAIEKIRKDIHVLDTIQGMSATKIETIRSVLFDQQQYASIYQYFYAHDAKPSLIDLITMIYQENAIEMIEENPYRILDDAEGVYFNDVDRLALKMGLAVDDEKRIQAIVYHKIKDESYRLGSTFVPYYQLLKQLIREDSTIDESLYEKGIHDLIEKKRIIDRDGRLFADIYDDAEQTIHDTLEYFNQMPMKEYDQKKVADTISKIEKRDHITFDDHQKEAIQQFLSSPIMILTGGPGTGKTTIVKAAIEVFRQLEDHCPIGLVAPTGRAAKRLSELTGLEAQTIHRLLKWDIQKNTFMYDASHPLDISLLIIDEFSMVDTVLFAKLLQASKKADKILLIGDHKQLPSVSPGQVLQDLLDVHAVFDVRLEHIYRQKESSGIIQLAHQIRQGTLSNDFDFDAYSDIQFIDSDTWHVLGITKKIVEKALSLGYDAQDIQVLAPMYQGVVGIEALNTMLQDTMNPKMVGQREIMISGRLYREGDKILQLKNRVDDNVFNGDIGTLVEIRFKDGVETFKDTIVIDFDGHIVEYTSEDHDSFRLAYCISIHKSQGSEFKVVIMPVVHDYRIMLQKKLLYTGITRAKQKLFLIGEKSAFYKGIHSMHERERLTYLKERFEEKENNEEPSFSPYDFT